MYTKRVSVYFVCVWVMILWLYNKRVNVCLVCMYYTILLMYYNIIYYASHVYLLWFCANSFLMRCRAIIGRLVSEIIVVLLKWVNSLNYMGWNLKGLWVKCSNRILATTLLYVKIYPTEIMDFRNKFGIFTIYIIYEYIFICV